MLRRFTSVFPPSSSATAKSIASISFLASSTQGIFSSSEIDLAKSSSALASKAKISIAARTKSCPSKKPALLAKSVLASSTNKSSSTSTSAKRKETTGTKKQQQSPQHLSEVADKPSLNAQQQAVLDYILANPKKSVFLTGSGGTGKSVLVRAIAEALPPQYTFLTAPTGVAALNIGGITLHSFLRLQPDGQFDLRAMLTGNVWADVQRRFWACNTLIIDEISMVDPSVFQAVDRLAQIARKSPEPFGGIQVILCGDFLQLPPVNTNGESGLSEEAKDDDGEDVSLESNKNATPANETKFNPRRNFPRFAPRNRCNADTTSKYCFQTHEWKRLNPKLFNLTQVMRQKEPELINLLNAIRFGKQTEAQMQTLLLPRGASDPENDVSDLEAPVRIFCRNREVNDRNRLCFNTLRKNRMLMLNHYDNECDLVSPHIPKPRELVYQCASVGDARIFGKVIPKRLPLCVGSRVMLLKNLDVTGGLVNGSTGVVVGFRDCGYEEIETMGGCSDSAALKAPEFDGKKIVAVKNNKKGNKKGNEGKEAKADALEDNMKVASEDFKIQFRETPTDVLKNTQNVFPVVKFNGVEKPVVITPQIWRQRSGGAVASKLMQLPLRHAWAITSHKAQGMTFSKVHVDLSNAFEKGQAYVALSRARTIEHLKVAGYDAKRVKACSIAAAFHEEVENTSQDAFHGLIPSAEGKSNAKK